MAHKLSKPNPQPDFPKLEKAVLARWKKEDTFKKSLAQTKDGKPYTFYDGPPFATGTMHYGHLLQGAIKDVIPRFRTMQGRYVERRFGWDCHGLPVELEMEKERGLMTRQEILEWGVDNYNAACRKIVLRYTKEWERDTTRLGRWVDFEDDYKTMDPAYMESVWWAIKQLHEAGLLYEGRKSMHICPRCATPLSNFEVGLGYGERQDPAVYVKFPLVSDPDVAVLAWTTTPWTLPANTLLAINPKLAYVEVEYEGARYVVAKNRVKDTFQGAKVKELRKVPAKELLGQKYEPPFPIEGLEGKHYEIVAADFVTDEDGTGIAHEAPAFGEEDMALAEKIGAPLVQHVAITGHFQEPFPRYHDKTALEANEPLIAELKQAGRLLRKETITHSYPHCWRCDTPLLNYATDSWFVAVTKVKDKLLKHNEDITWVPEHVKHGRFGKGLESAPDWSISRHRFWGNPLPIWKCDHGHVTVVGSLDELEQLSGQRPEDLHKEFVDKIEFKCPECDMDAKRIEDVLDCWFESGSMPYASRHYPFENKADWKDKFPADFIVEGLDQTRGWFYTLHVLATALFDSEAFRNVLLSGLVMAEDGKKMSKRLKNYPEPEQMFAKYGADAVRLYMMSSPIVRADNLNFAEKGVAETLRRFNVTLWNVYSFLATYAEVDGWEVAEPPKEPAHLLDRWILSRLDTLTDQLTGQLETLDLMNAARSLTDFLDELSNWYVRRSRRRFWKSQDDADKAEAYATLHHVLVTFCRLAAPITPFLPEHLYRELTGEESVHLASWPKAGTYQDEALERQMAGARRAVGLGLAARSKSSLKVRQPLAEARIIDHTSSDTFKNKQVVQIMAEELNVKQVVHITEEDSFVERIAKPDPKVIGPLAGKEAQKVLAAIKDGKYELDGEEVVVGKLRLPPEAVTLSYRPTGDYVVEGDAQMVVGLQTGVDDALQSEGVARELIRQFQELRKESGLEVSDRIAAGVVTSDPGLEKVVDSHRKLIEAEILAGSLELGEPVGENTKSVSIDGAEAELSLTKNEPS